MITCNIKCPDCDHTEPAQVDLHIMGGGSDNIFNVSASITDDSKADLAERFKAHTVAAHT